MPLSATPLLRRSLLLVGLVGVMLVSGCDFGDGFVSRTWMRARQGQWLSFATAEPIRPGSIPNVMAHLERARRDRRYSVPAGTVPEDAWDGIFDKIWRLRDTSDFDVLRLLNLLYGYGGDPAVSDGAWRKAKDAVLTFKYWYRDETPERIVDGLQVVDNMWYWTENHILIFRVCELLAGQLYPDEVFAVTGLTGREHRARAEPVILAWLDERARFGFTEWHSNVYYNLDLRPLLALVEWSENEVIAKRAAMVLDLVLLDTALHLHRGTFGATHGRSYVKDKASASTEDTFDSAKLFFDDTELPYSGGGSSTGAVLARSRKYRLPSVIRRIARHDAPMVDRQRMNLPLDEEPTAEKILAGPPEAPFGLDYRDEANLPFWWSMGSQPAWMMLPITLEVGERENLWDAQFSDFKALRDTIWIGNDFEAIVRNAQFLTLNLWQIINQSMLKEVNTYTYRTQHYMLSTAQDYRKGVRGSQTHTWQATLSERAMVWSQHPAYLPQPEGLPVPETWNWQRSDEPGPGYWTGEASQPRAAQHENVTIAIYAPQYTPNPLVPLSLRDETHAYFPHAHMDEVVQEGPWTFGRKDDGYVALYSWRPTFWRGGQPEVFQNAGLDFDLVAPGGATNVWIVQCGSADEWPGGFEEFREAIAASTVEVTPTAVAFDVRFESPRPGRDLRELALGWEGPLLVDGAPHALEGYPRMDNPFVQVDFLDTRYEVSDGEYSLVLDFANDLREGSAPQLFPDRPRLPRFLLEWLLRIFASLLRS